MSFKVSSPEFFPTDSIQIQLRQEPHRKPALPKRKVVKRVIKKIAKKAAIVPKKENVEEVTETPTPSSPQPKAFQSVINNYVQPHYPRLALRRKITGKVNLELIVMGNGKLKDVRIAQSSGNELLDNSALRAAQRWTFRQISANPNALYTLSKTVVYKIN